MTCDARRVKNGDYWSRLSYGQVVANRGGSLTIANERGKQWVIGSEIFADEFIVADQVRSTKDMTRTDLITEVMRHPRIAMTIWFRKKVKDTEVVKAVRALIEEGVAPNSRKFSSRIKDALAGEIREMKGRHESNHDEHGRLFFMDVESKGLRTVDPRTIEKAVINGVEYRVKTK